MPKSTSSQVQRPLINLVYRDGQASPDSLDDAASVLRLLGLDVNTIRFTSHVANSNSNSHALAKPGNPPTAASRTLTTIESAAQSKSRPSAMSRIVGMCTHPVILNDDGAVGLTDVCACDVVVLGTDLSRAQQTSLCGNAKKNVALITDATLKSAASGSWPDVFSLATVVVITASAARTLTASCELETAAKSMQHMFRRALILLVADDRLIYCTSNQVRSIDLPLKTPSNGDEMVYRFGAIAAVGLIRGCNAEQTALAAMAALSLESPATLAELIERGRTAVDRLARRQVRLAQFWRRTRLVGSAIFGSLLLVAVTLPWMSTISSYLTHSVVRH